MYRKILVPLDGSATAARGLEEAVGLARATGSSLALLHVMDVFPLGMEVANAQAWELLVESLRTHGQTLLAQARTVASEHGVAASDKLVEFPVGRVADVIVDEAKSQSCDLIVMGTHGRRGIGRALLGSDAELVLRQSPVPVLLVRGEGKAAG